jgi:hypothetical protein
MTRAVALAFWRVAMRRSYNLCVELLSATNDAVEIGYFAEPQQDSVANIKIGAREHSVVMFDVSMMELQNEGVLGSNLSYSGPP